jgi:hypothetical protein
MTYENCVLYAKQYEEEGNEEMQKFWEDRAARKAPKENKKKAEEIVEEVKVEEVKKKGRPKK